MLRLLVDENTHFGLLRGIIRSIPTLDFMLVRDMSLAGAPDEEVLAWAAQEDRVLITHDVKTVPPLAYARVAAGQALPGVLLIPANAALGRAISDCVLYITASHPKDIVSRVMRLWFPR